MIYRRPPRCFCLILLMALVARANAAHPQLKIIQYRSAAEEAHVTAIASELRCMHCQNQSVAESHATLALVTKQQIVRLVRQGKTDAEIRAYFVSRYGDLISYRPPLNRNTWILWFGPFAVLIAGALWLLRQIAWPVRPSIGSKTRQPKC